MTPGPLTGYKVAVTAERRSVEQADLLRRRGATVLVGPTVQSVTLADDGRVDSAIDQLVRHPPALTILLTARGTRDLLDAAEGLGRADDLRRVLSASEIVARGPKAAGAAVAAELGVSSQLTGERSLEILERVRRFARRGARIAIQRDGARRPRFADVLAAEGADVVDLVVYEWALPGETSGAARVLEAACRGSLDAVTFTSSPAVENLLALSRRAGRESELLAALAGPVRAVCIGPVCAATASELGIRSALTPGRHRLGAMVQAVEAELASRGRVVDFDGCEVRVQGSCLIIGPAVAHLADRERAVLHALLDAHGAVVPKHLLLRKVWSGGLVDDHAVEVTVARLRRRLGRAGRALQTVPRRGYRLVAATPR